MHETPSVRWGRYCYYPSFTEEKRRLTRVKPFAHSLTLIVGNRGFAWHWSLYTDPHYSILLLWVIISPACIPVMVVLGTATKGHSWDVCDPLRASIMHVVSLLWRQSLPFPTAYRHQTFQAQAQPAETHRAPTPTVGTRCWGRRKGAGFSRQFSLLLRMRCMGTMWKGLKETPWPLCQHHFPTKSSCV